MLRRFAFVPLSLLLAACGHATRPVRDGLLATPDSRGRPTRVEHRGRSSIVLRDQPLILVDEVEVSDFSLLGSMPASDVLEIEVLTGVDATTYYGTNATKGAIRIRTKVGRS